MSKTSTPNRTLYTEVKNPALLPLFEELRALLKPYEKYFQPYQDNPGYYGLYAKKDVIINGRKKPEVYFAGLIVQKHYVGFYYMSIYYDPTIASFLGPELLARLKGKSCFYITKSDSVVMNQIKDALEVGLNQYSERGWLA